MLEMEKLYPRELLKKKDKWYRLQEREHTKVRIEKYPIGSWIEAERIIIRAGYYYQPEDMAEEELDKRRVELITANVNWIERMEEPYRKMIEFHVAPNHIYPNQAGWRPEYLKGSITEDEVAKILSVITGWGNTRLGQIDYELRGGWVKEQRKKLPHDEQYLRTFWYVDYNFAGQVREYKNKLIGVRVSGGTRGYYYEDYEPPYLDTWLRQNLYMVGWSDPGISFVNRNKFHEIYVHPADLIEVHR